MRYYHSWLFITLINLITVPTHLAEGAAPHSSHFALSFGNGHCAAVYDVSQTRITTLTDHLYAKKSATEQTLDLCYDTYFGLRDQGQNLWLGGATAAEVSYIPGTGIVKVVQNHKTLTAEQYFFSPRNLPFPVLVMIVKVSASADTNDAALFSLHNFHLGDGTDGTNSEQIIYNSGQTTFWERGTNTGRVMLIKSLTPPDRHGATPQNPYLRVLGGNTLEDVNNSGVTNDAISGFQYNLKLKAGSMAWYGVIQIAGNLINESQLPLALNSYLSGRSIEQLLNAEIQSWADWHLVDVTPQGLSADEQAVYSQALNILRMGQCQEPNTGSDKPFGQLVASMPPGKWNISWVRDAAYAIVALAQAGHLTEARDAVLFMLKGSASHYIFNAQGSPYVGRPYAISVTRYFGNGTEESDENEDGPNIEFDNFGLFLWATEAVVSRMTSSDADVFFADWYDKIKNEVADVLLSLIETESGLLRADSSIWEHHWDNGKRRHHTYSNVMAVAGLRAMARLSTLYGKTADATQLETAAMAITTAIAAKLVDGAGILTSDLESMSLGPGGFMDTAVVEAFLQEVLPLQGPVADKTLQAFQQHLALSTGPGFKRNDDGDAYDEQEWVVMDLRISAAHFLRGEKSEGQEILAWITGMARANYNLIPELLDPQSANYAGEVPMVGFGAGAYILSLFHRAEVPAPQTDSGILLDGGADSAPSDSRSPDIAQSFNEVGSRADMLGPTTSSAGCGCGMNPSPPRGVRLVLLLLGFFCTRGYLRRRTPQQR